MLLKLLRNLKKEENVWPFFYFLGMILHLYKSWFGETINSSTQWAEAGRGQGQSGLQVKFQDTEGYTEKPYIKKPKQKH